MFDSELNEDVARQRVTRRAFLLSGGAAAVAVAGLVTPFCAAAVVNHIAQRACG